MKNGSADNKSLRFMAVMYASRPGILEYVRLTGRLPGDIASRMGGAHIQARFVRERRGTDPVLTDDETLVYESLLRERQMSPANGDSKIDATVRGGVLWYRPSPANGGLVFAVQAEAERVHAIRTALNAATWGQFRRLMPIEAYEELLDTMIDSANGPMLIPDDKQSFEQDTIPGVADGDYPDWLQVRMDDVVPQDILERFGKAEFTTLNGSYWYLDPAREPEIVEALADAGFVVEKREDLEFY